jgi:hypothetical protein
VRFELKTFFFKHTKGAMHLVDQILSKFEEMQIIQSSLGQRYADLSQIKYNKKEEYVKYEVKL